MSLKNNSSRKKSEMVFHESFLIDQPSFVPDMLVVKQIKFPNYANPLFGDQHKYDFFGSMLRRYLPKEVDGRINFNSPPESILYQVFTGKKNEKREDKLHALYLSIEYMKEVVGNPWCTSAGEQCWKINKVIEPIEMVKGCGITTCDHIIPEHIVQYFETV